MNLEPFTGPGSTPSRRRFWDKVTAAVIASQKLAGQFVTVDEHIGKGTVINVADTSTRRPTPPPGVCCDTETITIVFSDIVDCPSFSGDLNGSYVLTETSPGSGIWEGSGGEFFQDDIGPFPTLITIQCGGETFSIDYRAESSSPPFFLTGIIAIPPSFTDIPSIITDCSESGASGGTATITCGS